MPLHGDDSLWKNNKRINEDFYSIISEIDHNIEVILTVVNDCFAEE